MKRTTPISMEDPATKSAFDIGREYRILRTGAETEQAAQGVVPEAARIADVSTEAGTKLDTEIDSQTTTCLLYTSPSPRDGLLSRMPSSA